MSNTQRMVSATIRGGFKFLCYFAAFWFLALSLLQLWTIWAMADFSSQATGNATTAYFGKTVAVFSAMSALGCFIASIAVFKYGQKIR